MVGSRLIEGYEWAGEHIHSRVEVVSMYLEQRGSWHGSQTQFRPDIGLGIADRNGVPVFPTISEALGCGDGGVNVDGVVIIGEHGDYPSNEYGQKLYPRRRLFDTATATMVGADRFVPVFTDKHLECSFSDGRSMVETAERLGCPLLAGSTIPLAWRVPTGAEWPAGATMHEAVAIGFGDPEGYGFHTLEGLQVHAERRAGAETGVKAVRALSGEDATRALTDGTVSATLLDEALGTLDLDGPARRHVIGSATDVFLVDYTDGLRGAVVTCSEGVRNWAIACRGPGDSMACQMFLPGTTPGSPVEHFTFLVRQIESMVLEGVAPYPARRTLLTTGILEAAMRSRHEGGRQLDTPDLAVTYEPPGEVPDTGVPYAYPEPVRPIR
ncbi:MAG: hypothetical protein ACRDO8_07135 [Nocardioidaceae bacterium]